MNSKLTIIIIALSVTFTLQGSLFAQSNAVKKIQSNASEVTVFLNGAQVTREVSVQIPAGESLLKFENLSPYIEQNSIQVRANNGLTILSVNYEYNYLAKNENNPEIENLKNKLELIQEELTLENAHLSVVKEDIAFLQANRNIGGQNTTITAAALQQTSEFYSKTITKLKIKEINRTKTINKLTSQRDTLKRQIQEWQQDKDIPFGEIVVKTQSPLATTYNLELTYVVGRASWTPSYDIRSQSINEPLKIAYKANVIQNTRENWKNIKLRFSSANPNLSGTAPTLYPYYLKYPQPIAMRGSDRTLKSQTSNDNDLQKTMVLEEENFVMLSPILRVNQTSVEFEITTPYTINSDGKNYTVDMSTIELPAIYKYYSAPKLDTDAFLIARVTEWEKYNLLEGEANIFFEGTFVGKTFLDMNSAKDTLELSLGRDKSITIKREQIKEYTTKQFIGSNQEEEISWRIQIKNNKNEQLNMLLVDQAPLSTIEDIEVSVKEISGGKQNAQTGEVQWQLTLKPLETKDLIFTYTVKYPKNKSLVIQ